MHFSLCFNLLYEKYQTRSCLYKKKYANVKLIRNSFKKIENKKPVLDSPLWKLEREIHTKQTLIKLGAEAHVHSFDY